MLNRSVLVLLTVLSIMGVGLLAGCQPGTGAEGALGVEDDLSDASYTFTAHDSSTVAFPGDLEGNVLVVGYIYTHCPDICSMITANMLNVRSALDSTEGVRFVSVTFDPERDTPAVLAEYREAFGLNDTPWLFLHADSATTRPFLDRMGVRRSFRTAEGQPVDPDTAATYLVDHTDQITLIDAQGRVRQHYGGSMTPPDILMEDINALRAED